MSWSAVPGFSDGPELLAVPPYVSEWCPCGLLEILLHHHVPEKIVGIKYCLAAEVFGNDEIPKEPPTLLTLLEYIEKFYQRQGRLISEHSDEIAARVEQMHQRARTFLEQLPEKERIPLSVWMDVRHSIVTT